MRKGKGRKENKRFVRSLKIFPGVLGTPRDSFCLCRPLPRSALFVQSQFLSFF